MDTSKPEQMHTKLSAWVDSSWSKYENGFVIWVRKKWECEMLRMKNRLQRVYFSEHSRRTCLLPSSLLLFIVACKWYAFDKGRHSRPPKEVNLRIFYLPPQRMPPSSLTSYWSTALSFLGWDILHWCNGSKPWSLKAKEKYCIFWFVLTGWSMR